jgi:HSP20 family molecular chaperone IbpA
MKLAKYIFMKYSLINNGIGSSLLSDFFNVNADLELNSRFPTFKEGCIQESKDGHVITLQVPGMTKKDIEITCENNSIKVRGSKKINDQMTTVIRKDFAANINIDPQSCTAKVENGILTINLVKNKSINNTIKIT